jgi:hypothetical protein
MKRGRSLCVSRKSIAILKIKIMIQKLATEIVSLETTYYQYPHLDVTDRNHPRLIVDVNYRSLEYIVKNKNEIQRSFDDNLERLHLMNDCTYGPEKDCVMEKARIKFEITTNADMKALMIIKYATLHLWLIKQAIQIIICPSSSSSATTKRKKKIKTN